MGYDFRPAVRDHTSVLIGLAGASGSGKTLSALKLATGLAGKTGKIAFIDTERGRGKHYAPPPGVPADPAKGTFAFDYLELNPPFAPARYLDAIRAADEAGYAVIVIDSFSHVWEGEGGVLDMQEAEFARMGSRDAVKMASWIKPKGEHKRMVGRLIQCRAHLLICLRAQEKVKIVKGAGGKQEIIAASERPPAERWEPICEKRFPYELTASFVLQPGDPGVPVPVKLQDQHRAFFPEGQKISEAAGAGLAAWAGGKPAEPVGAAPLTRGEVKELEHLIQKAAAANAIGPIEVELYERAIQQKDAKAVRDGIRQLSQATAA